MEKLINQSAKISRRHFMKASAALSMATITGTGNLHGTVSEVFKAGAAAVDITPGMDVPLKGPIAGALKPQGLLDRLNARAIVLDDGTTRIGIVVCDVCMISQEICDKDKDMIYQRTGIPPSRILISATHSHSVVRAIDLELGESHDRYREMLSVRIADAVEEAFTNLAPAKIGWGVGSKPEHCLNRRWIMKPGTIRPDPFGGTTDQVLMGGWAFRENENALRPAGPVDPALSILSLQFSDGRPMALLANFSIHYGSGGDKISADYFGHYARGIEEHLGRKDGRPPMVGIMSNGTSGDITSGGEPVKLAQSLIGETLDVYKGINHKSWVPLRMEESEIEIGIRLPTREQIRWAEEVVRPDRQKPVGEHPRTETYARNMLKLAKWPSARPFKFQTIRIGQLGIAAVPTETFAKTGLAIKKQSPLSQTFVIELANGYGGYLPTPEDHELGGYETWQTISSFMEIQAEPKIRNEIARLFEKVS